MAQMKNHRHLPAFILLDLVQHVNHGSAICHNLVRDLPDFQCDTAAVYRALSRLEREGAVVYHWDTTQSGPARKVYLITEKGNEQLVEWKKDVESRIKKLNHFLTVYKKLRINE